MKNAASILLYLFFSVVLSAQTIKYTSTNLNLRSGPSTSYSVLTTIPLGTGIVMAEECDCFWIKVQYNGVVGYVSSNYLTFRQSIRNQNQYTTTNQWNTNSTVKYYTNSVGRKVQSPTYYDSAPTNATALCRDGTYSFSQSRRGTCSRHGGVAQWF